MTRKYAYLKLWRWESDEALLFSQMTIKKIKNEDAPSVWFETSGAAAAIEAAVECIARNGRISVTGIGVGPWNVNMKKVAQQNINILGRWGGNLEYLDEVVDMIRTKSLKLDAIISDVMPMTEWQKAFRMLRQKEAIKILLDPSC